MRPIQKCNLEVHVVDFSRYEFNQKKPTIRNKPHKNGLGSGKGCQSVKAKDVTSYIIKIEVQMVGVYVSLIFCKHVGYLLGGTPLIIHSPCFSINLVHRLSTNASTSFAHLANSVSGLLYVRQLSVISLRSSFSS